MTFMHKLSKRLAMSWEPEATGRVGDTCPGQPLPLRAVIQDRLSVLPLLLLAVLACETAPLDPRYGSLSGLIVHPNQAHLTPRATEVFRAFGRLAGGDSVPVPVKWAATGGQIDAQGMFIADQTPGQYLVVATHAERAFLVDTSRVLVEEPPVHSVAVTPDAASLVEGDTVRLRASVRDDAGNPLSDRALSWASSNPSVAKVDGSGLVTGVAAGSALVTVGAEAKSDTATITVTRPPVASVTVIPATGSLVVCDSVRLAAELRDARGNVLSGVTVSWTSADTTVARVSTAGLVRAVAPGMTAILAHAEGQQGQASLIVDQVSAASVSVSPSVGSIEERKTIKLTATVRDAAGNQLTGRLVTWASLNNAVATVDGAGLVTGVTTGSVIITAATEGKSDSATVTVTPALVASVVVSPATATVTVGGTRQLVATLRDAGGTVLTGRPVTWASVSPALASVDASGLVRGVATGTALITATAEGKSDTAAITVTPVPVATVTVTPATATVTVGGTQQLVATLRDPGGTTLTGRPVTWTSLTPALASVDGGGLVRGVATGAALITATAEGKSDTAAITVTPVPVASVTVSPTSAQIDAGGTRQFTATLRDAAGNVLSGRLVTWSSSNTAIVSVNASGLATALASGTASLFATAEGQADTASVSVVSPAGLIGWYVAPSGLATGDGSIGNPWSLDAVLAKGATLAGTRLTSVPNGDGGTVPATIVWVRGGTYGSGGTLKVPTLQGTASNPVILRAYPGERVTFDLRFSTTNAPDLWFWGIESTNTSTDLSQNIMGFDTRSARVRYINCVVHNHLGNGIGWWVSAVNSRIYGSLIYNNGRQLTGAGSPYAHGVYLQNDPATGTKHLKHTVVFNNLGFNIHGFGSDAAKLGNTLFKDWVLIGGGVVWNVGTMGDATFDGLIGYSGSPSGSAAGLGQIGPNAGYEVPGRLTWINTYARYSGWTIARWRDVIFTDNELASVRLPFVIEHDIGVNPAWSWDRQTYWGPNGEQNLFRFDDPNGTAENEFPGWRTFTGYDPNSTFTTSASGKPTTNRVFVLTNDHEPKTSSLSKWMGFVAIFNWQNLGSVAVDVSSMLNNGDQYEVRHVFDPFGTPVTTGTYNGGTVSIPMTAVAPTAPTTGWPQGTPPPTPGPEFGTFVIVRR